jgi:phage terminase small subunit
MKSPKPPPPIKVPIEVAENVEAKKEFLRVMQILDGKLDGRDQSLLVDYALTHAEIMELRVCVASEGRVLEGPKGGAYLNPTVNLLISRQGHLGQLRRDLYFTPKSRIEKQHKAALSKGRAIRDSLAQDDDQD